MHNSLSTHLWIFSIGRGNAAFVRTGLNQGFILDMGGGDLFDPASFMKTTLVPGLDPYKGSKVAQAVLSHPHADHISQCEWLDSGSLRPALLTCPHDKPEAPPSERIDWSRLGATDRSKAQLIETYKDLYGDRRLPLQTIEFASARSVPNLEYGIYYLCPAISDRLHPSDDNKYGNALSVMLYLRQGQNSVLFPGDMTPEGMESVLGEVPGLEKRYTVFNREISEARPTWSRQTSDQPALRDLLADRGLSILVAPHHGLESCFSPELFQAIRGGMPQLNVISDRRRVHPGDGAVDYRYQAESGAFGLPVLIEGRTERHRSVSTKLGHHILIVFSGTSRPRVYLERDIQRLRRYAV